MISLASNEKDKMKDEKKMRQIYNQNNLNSFVRWRLKIKWGI